MTRCIRCIAAIVLISTLTAGCTGFGQSAAERRHRWAAVIDNDTRGLVEDVDMLLMTDEPARLSKWHTR